MPESSNPQTLPVDAKPIGGTFTISRDDQSETLPHDATPEMIDAAVRRVVRASSVLRDTQEPSRPAEYPSGGVR